MSPPEARLGEFGRIRRYLAPLAAGCPGALGLTDDAALLTVPEGRQLVVTVLPDGFDHDGTVYRSLSAVARAITGTQWNGHVFFGLKSAHRGRGAA